MKIISNIISAIRDNRIMRDSSWAVIGSAVSKCAAMVVGIIIARLLGVEAFGEYGMVKSTLFYIAVFSTFGLGSTATRYMAQCEEQDYSSIANIIRNSISITLITSLVMAVLLFTCAQYITDEPHLISILRYTALIVIFNAINTTQLGLLSGLKLFRTIAINNTISGFATLILGIALTYYLNLVGAVMSLFATTFLQCILNQIALHKYLVKAREASDKSAQKSSITSIKNLFKFSLPIALQESVYASASWIRIMMITSFAGYDELGLYTATNQCHLIIIFIPNVLRNVILSHLSSSLKDDSHHKQTFSTMLKINLISALLPALFIALLSPVIEQIYGDSFVGLAPVIVVCAISSIFESICDIYVQEFISQGRNWINFVGYVFRNYGSLLVALPLLMKFGNHHGAFMAYGAIMVIQIVYCILLHILYKRTTHKPQAA
ncbi:MAG: oligosaccharide flippase family protein [Alistipes sp.]|nr:oligosaccharide flippase family protein [Alistipes sp.]